MKTSTTNSRCFGYIFIKYSRQQKPEQLVLNRNELQLQHIFSPAFGQTRKRSGTVRPMCAGGSEYTVQVRALGLSFRDRTLELEIGFYISCQPFSIYRFCQSRLFSTIASGFLSPHSVSAIAFVSFLSVRSCTKINQYLRQYILISSCIKCKQHLIPCGNMFERLGPEF